MIPKYLKDSAAFDSFRLTLKQIPCSHCHSTDNLICHGFLRGYGVGSNLIIRGWRIFCSNRKRRLGCGKTIPILLSQHLYRRTVTASLLTLFLKNIHNGFSLTRSWPACSHTVECASHLWRSWEKIQFQIRSRLSTVAAPPSSSLIDHLKQTIEHFFSCFGSVADFQEHFQDSFL